MQYIKDFYPYDKSHKIFFDDISAVSCKNDACTNF